MSRLFPLRYFYIKDLEVYVLMLTWEVWTYDGFLHVNIV